MASLIQHGDNPELTEERKRATFSVHKLAAFLYGGEEKLKRREEIAKFVESSPDLQDPKAVEFMTRPERVENAARKVVSMVKYADMIDASDVGEAAYYQNLVMARDAHPMALHYVMFLPAIQGQGSDEQQEKWLPLAATRAIIGTYAQTELGHGTNLRKLETTATYDPKTQEFVMHSPTITATKWWPGCLGKSSNHAVVVAQLWTQGKCYGPHPFIVQLRHLDTHQPLPGIKVGDIGPKFGLSANDNGFLIFDNVRIPRENMLMRYSQVLPGGEYVKPTHSKLAYGTMVFVRSVMIRDQGMALGMAATIAIRYSVIRRQGEPVEGRGESKVLDYQTQQYRLFPQLAKAYAYYFAGLKTRQMYESVTAQIKGGNAELLPELHAVSAGLKAVVTHEVALGIEQCRLACGGHGYSLASGLPELYGLTVGACTYEGDNIVLLLQVARFLVKAVHQVKAGDAALADVTEYLGRVGPKKCSLNQSQDFADRSVVEAFEHVAHRKVFSAVNRLDTLRAQGAKPEDAWNACSVDLCKASRAHVRVYLVKTFLSVISEMHDANVARVLRTLAQVYVYDSITSSAEAFIEDGYMSGQQLEYVRLGLYASMADLRANAVALVDSFHFRDREMRSVLGRRDGHVYPNMLEWAKQSELNQSQVLPAYRKYLGPMMKEARSKL